MGLTIFVSKKDSHVRILQWFSTALGCGLEGPCGPVLCFDANEFRRVGKEIIRRHFVEYQTRRLTKENVVDVFTTQAEKRTLSDQRAVRVVEEKDGQIRFIPIEFERLSLTGLKCLAKEADQYVPTGASESDFWAAFDRALEYSISLR